jgi:prenyltransferase beta subunit
MNTMRQNTIILTAIVVFSMAIFIALVVAVLKDISNRAERKEIVRNLKDVKRAIEYFKNDHTGESTVLILRIAIVILVLFILGLCVWSIIAVATHL